VSDDVAGEVERYQFWVEDLIRQRNDALGRVDDLAGQLSGNPHHEVRYPEVVPDPEPEPEPSMEPLLVAEGPMVEKMRWSLGLREGQMPMGPEEPGWLYLLPDGSRSNSCDEARAAWLIHCEQVGERMNSVVRGIREIVLEAVGENDASPYEAEILDALDTMDAIITTTVAQPQPTPPEMLPKMRREPRPVIAVLEDEIDADAEPDAADTDDAEPDAP